MYLNDLQIKRLIRFNELTDSKWINLVNPASIRSRCTGGKAAILRNKSN